MIRITITILFLFFLSDINSQEIYSKLIFTKNNCPTYIVNNNIIANQKVIEIHKGFILDISVLKDKPTRDQDKIYNLTENGVVFIKLKNKLKYKTQNELNIFFGLNSKNNLYVNGYLLEESDYKIATESIIDIELISPNTENKFKNKTINVWTLTKEERTTSCSK